MRGVTGSVRNPSTPGPRSSSRRQGGPRGPRPEGGSRSPHRSGRGEWEVLAVPDIAYVLLLVGGFLALALTLRGLERL